MFTIRNHTLMKQMLLCMELLASLKELSHMKYWINLMQIERAVL